MMTRESNCCHIMQNLSFVLINQNIMSHRKQYNGGRLVQWQTVQSQLTSFLHEIKFHTINFVFVSFVHEGLEFLQCQKQFIYQFLKSISILSNRFITLNRNYESSRKIFIFIFLTDCRWFHCDKQRNNHLITHNVFFFTNFTYQI